MEDVLKSRQNFLIYSIKSSENKFYVGQTRELLSQRWRRHVSAANTGVNLEIADAIRRLGKDNFSIVKVDEANNQQDADLKEIEWVKKLNSRYPNGYNKESGGKLKKERCVAPPEDTANLVDRTTLPLYINFAYDKRGYHSFIVRDTCKDSKIPQKSFRSGKLSLDDARKNAETYLEQYIPRTEWIIGQNKMSATRCVNRFPVHEQINIQDENESLPQCIYIGKAKDDRIYYIVQDFRKEKRFPPTTFRSGKRTPQECRKLAEEYLAQYIPKEIWKSRRIISPRQKKVQRLDGDGSTTTCSKA